jgi:D-arabinose 1-dehydrogenase-like Zn-dependent alcohol dehydrogenase
VVDFIGSPGSLRWATASVASGGRVVVLTTFPDTTGVLDPQRLVVSESTILGSRYATRAEVSLAAMLVAQGRVKPVIGMVTGPDQVLEIHRRLREQTLIGRGAIAWSEQ